jgi:hypothetical protein
MATYPTPECGVDVCVELPHIWAAEAIDLDMDRTTIRSQVYLDALMDIAVDPYFGIDAKQMAATQVQTEADGGTYSPMGYLMQSLPDDKFNKLGQEFMDTEIPGGVYEDAVPLYVDLHTGQRVPNIYMTYGVSNLWQAMKAARSGYTGYVAITSTSDKGPNIEAGRGQQGTFDYVAVDEMGDPLAVYHAQRRVLIDDKIKAHKNLPPDCRGYALIRPDEPRLPSQKGEIPSNVTAIGTLGDIAIDRTIEISDCKSTRTVDVDALKPYAFIPLNRDGTYLPGLVIGQTVSFEDLRAEISGYRSVA